MINFHKYGFLDCKRLLAYVQQKSYWLKEYNPIWLFVWSDIYKPEIAFTNSFIYIRIYHPAEGMLYYPPIGDGDLRLAIFDLKEECKRLGVDFKLTAIDSDMKLRLNEMRIDTIDKRDKFSYIYSADNLTLTNKKSFKNEIKALKEFYRNNPDILAKSIKKDDFPAILEFINNWNTIEHYDLAGVDIYKRLNMIKKCMESLYELNLVGLVLKDEERIYGFSLASVINNTAYIHAFMFLENIVGLREALLASYARLISREARYINFESDLNKKEVREVFLKLKPLKLEPLYETFLDEDEN